MVERTVPAVWVLATTCWIVGGGLLVASIFVGDWPARIGFIAISGGVTFTVKGFLNKLWECEVSAFRLGERAERERQERGGVRSIR